MRRAPFLLLVVVPFLLFGARAHAGTLTSATWFQATQGVPMTRTFAALGATGSSLGSASIAVNLSYPFFVSSFFVAKTPSAPLDLFVEVTQGGSQAITATPGMANGTPGVPGTVIIMSAVHQGMGVNASMFHVGIDTIVQVPIRIGQAGTFTSTFLILGQLHALTVDFYGWTPGSLTFSGLTSKYAPLPNASAAGSFGLTPQGGGTVTLVTPTKLSIDGSFAQQRTVSFVALQLSFVPEPSTLLLLAAAGLALVFRARRPGR